MISINNLCFSYTSKPPFILNNININIPKGAYVSIIGPNGSSKTTLVKLMLKQLKPINGSIEVTTNKIGYVPQKVESFNSQFTITVKEVLSCHANALNLHDKKQIDKFIERVNMKEFKNKLIGTLSGGQQQKIFIARALMGNPELLVLDELSAGVDHSSQKEIYGLIKDLNKRKGITILSVEHNLKLALDYSTHILQLHEGKATLYTVDEYSKIINNGTLFKNRKVE
ncbi:metal ABC transporter ATP-binding protein [Clostridium polyendosporum]|uniref:Metal ABC transporter ATP-binding protein n=1 Tax=Clostridium polyendosporum TaxID=69208 RepID=A0A919RW96_9CLOT|nr:metal ABC transporter ATP-binding protein [Clostridium polyendosporum]GIM27489.1 metal ABC transporter ATP-binding protein [Clostridium polyendosporum]